MHAKFRPSTCLVAPGCRSKGVVRVWGGLLQESQTEVVVEESADRMVRSPPPNAKQGSTGGSLKRGRSKRGDRERWSGLRNQFFSAQVLFTVDWRGVAGYWKTTMFLETTTSANTNILCT